MYLFNQQLSCRPIANFWANYFHCPILDHTIPGTHLNVDTHPWTLITHAGLPLQLPYLTDTSIPRKNHPLMKALGPIQPDQVILDATCGLGQDSFMLAMHGYRVIACEQNKVLIPLLHQASGLIQQKNHEGYWGLYHGDSCQLMQHYPPHWPTPHAIIIDPMYPTTPSSALPKKAMQRLRDLNNDTSSPDLLLTSALQCKCPTLKRIIVKRPHQAPPLSNIKPDVMRHHTKPFKHRFDIYHNHQS